MADISTLVKIYDFIIKSNLKGYNFPISIWGKHGVGKTSITREFFESKGYNVVALNISLQSPEDLLGQIDGNGGYHRPKWMTPEKSKTKTVYFLDEFNRGQKYTIQCFFNFILEGRLHNHHINKHDIVLCACNPDSEDYLVTSFDDKAMLSRFTHLPLTINTKDFVKYIKNKYEGECVSVMEKVFEKTANVFPNTNINLHFKIAPDARSLEKVTAMLSMLDKDSMEDFGFELISGTVGIEAASIIKEVFLQNVVFKSIDILNNGHAGMNLNLDKIELVNSINIDMNNTIEEYLKTDKFNKTQIANLIAWINAIPKDCAVKLLQSISKNENMKLYIFDIISSNFEIFSNVIATSE